MRYFVICITCILFKKHSFVNCKLTSLTSFFCCDHHNNKRRLRFNTVFFSSSSSSDRVDSRGPLHQPRVATTTSLVPFGTNAEGCTIADLLDPWMAQASWPSPPTRTKTGGQFLLLRPMMMHGGLECGHQGVPLADANIPARHFLGPRVGAMGACLYLLPFNCIFMGLGCYNLL